ncbi:hypothetical protein FB567DRAFT_519669 [Paraphoma chrysanthemicola]|uniref:Uncharacterized protein n=1 Tax=Paraphoma chrysanthemicola TaxID=798071 RepID=A0A8K0W130_9PLEO|nr:hypothetical protein FB567DRAFT_519669 [Paraphoma chrysanthemicola]
MNANLLTSAGCHSTFRCNVSPRVAIVLVRDNEQLKTVWQLRIPLQAYPWQEQSSRLQSRIDHTAFAISSLPHDVSSIQSTTYWYSVSIIWRAAEMHFTQSLASLAIILIATFIGLYRSLPALFLSICPAISPQTCPTTNGHIHSGYFGYECAGNKPHHSSWTSWWHPQGSQGVAAEHKHGAGAITNKWNILYHLGGNGPWVEKVIDVVDGGIAVPEGCRVRQVHMVGSTMACGDDPRC